MIKKNSLTIIILLLAVVFLCSCASPISSMPAPPEQSKDGAEAMASDENESSNVLCAPDNTTSIVDLPANITVRIDNTEPELYYDSQTNDDIDNLILTFIAEKPVVSIENNDIATDKINEFFEKMNEEIISGDDFGIGNVKYPGRENMIAAAFDNYQVHIDYDLDIKLDFAFSHTVDFLRCDENVISILFTDYLYNGTDSGALTKYSYSFDTSTGILLTDSIFDSKASIVSYLKTSELFSEESAENALSLGNWYIGSDGVVFFSNETYLDEPSGFTVPFDELGDVFKHSYSQNILPSSGIISAVRTAENQGKPIEDIIVVNDEGDTVYLNVSGVISDIRISLVQYSDIDSKFYVKSVMWASNYLRDCFIQFSIDIPDGMPNLMIEYVSEGVKTQKLLSESGADSMPILVESTINAVG